MTITITDQTDTETVTVNPMPCASTCTVEQCVNQNDPIAQADCDLC